MTRRLCRGLSTIIERGMSSWASTPHATETNDDHRVVLQRDEYS
jgi:hypothetical protein